MNKVAAVMIICLLFFPNVHAEVFVANRQSNQDAQTSTADEISPEERFKEQLRNDPTKIRPEDINTETIKLIFQEGKEVVGKMIGIIPIEYWNHADFPWSQLDHSIVPKEKVQNVPPEKIKVLEIKYLEMLTSSQIAQGKNLEDLSKPTKLNGQTKLYKLNSENLQTALAQKFNTEGVAKLVLRSGEGGLGLGKYATIDVTKGILKNGEKTGIDLQSTLSGIRSIQALVNGGFIVNRDQSGPLQIEQGIISSETKNAVRIEIDKDYTFELQFHEYDGDKREAAAKIAVNGIMELDSGVIFSAEDTKIKAGGKILVSRKEDDYYIATQEAVYQGTVLVAQGSTAEIVTGSDNVVVKEGGSFVVGSGRQSSGNNVEGYIPSLNMYIKGSYVREGDEVKLGRYLGSDGAVRDDRILSLFVDLETGVGARGHKVDIHLVDKVVNRASDQNQLTQSEARQKAAEVVEQFTSDLDENIDGEVWVEKGENQDVQIKSRGKVEIGFHFTEKELVGVQDFNKFSMRSEERSSTLDFKANAQNIDFTTTGKVEVKQPEIIHTKDGSVRISAVSYEAKQDGASLRYIKEGGTDGIQVSCTGCSDEQAFKIERGILRQVTSNIGLTGIVPDVLSFNLQSSPEGITVAGIDHANAQSFHSELGSTVQSGQAEEIVIMRPLQMYSGEQAIVVSTESGLILHAKNGPVKLFETYSTKEQKNAISFAIEEAAKYSMLLTDTPERAKAFVEELRVSERVAEEQLARVTETVAGSEDFLERTKKQLLEVKERREEIMRSPVTEETRMADNDGDGFVTLSELRTHAKALRQEATRRIQEAPAAYTQEGDIARLPGGKISGAFSRENLNRQYENLMRQAQNVDTILQAREQKLDQNRAEENELQRQVEGATEEMQVIFQQVGKTVKRAGKDPLVNDYLYLLTTDLAEREAQLHARNYFAAGFYDEAVESAMEVMESNYVSEKTREDSRFLAGIAHLNAGRINEAFGVLEELKDPENTQKRDMLKRKLRAELYKHEASVFQEEFLQTQVDIDEQKGEIDSAWDVIFKPHEWGLNLAYEIPEPGKRTGEEGLFGKGYSENKIDQLREQYTAASYLVDGMELLSVWVANGEDERFFVIQAGTPEAQKARQAEERNKKFRKFLVDSTVRYSDEENTKAYQEFNELLLIEPGSEEYRRLTAEQKAQKDSMDAQAARLLTSALISINSPEARILQQRLDGKLTTEEHQKQLFRNALAVKSETGGSQKSARLLRQVYQLDPGTAAGEMALAELIKTEGSAKYFAEDENLQGAIFAAGEFSTQLLPALLAGQVGGLVAEGLQGTRILTATTNVASKIPLASRVSNAPASVRFFAQIAVEEGVNSLCGGCPVGDVLGSGTEAIVEQTVELGTKAVVRNIADVASRHAGDVAKQVDIDSIVRKALREEAAQTTEVIGKNLAEDLAKKGVVLDELQYQQLLQDLPGAVAKGRKEMIDGAAELVAENPQAQRIVSLEADGAINVGRSGEVNVLHQAPEKPVRIVGDNLQRTAESQQRFSVNQLTREERIEQWGGEKLELLIDNEQSIFETDGIEGLVPEERVIRQEGKKLIVYEEGESVKLSRTILSVPFDEAKKIKQEVRTAQSDFISRSSPENPISAVRAQYSSVEEVLKSTVASGPSGGRPGVSTSFFGDKYHTTTSFGIEQVNIEYELEIPAERIIKVRRPNIAAGETGPQIPEAFRDLSKDEVFSYGFDMSDFMVGETEITFLGEVPREYVKNIQILPLRDGTVIDDFPFIPVKNENFPDSEISSDFLAGSSRTTESQQRFSVNQLAQSSQEQADRILRSLSANSRDLVTANRVARSTRELVLAVNKRNTEKTFREKETRDEDILQLGNVIVFTGRSGDIAIAASSISPQETNTQGEPENKLGDDTILKEGVIRSARYAGPIAVSYRVFTVGTDDGTSNGVNDREGLFQRPITGQAIAEINEESEPLTTDSADAVKPPEEIPEEIKVEILEVSDSTVDINEIKENLRAYEYYSGVQPPKGVSTLSKKVSGKTAQVTRVRKVSVDVEFELINGNIDSTLTQMKARTKIFFDEFNPGDRLDKKQLQERVCSTPSVQNCILNEPTIDIIPSKYEVLRLGTFT